MKDLSLIVLLFSVAQYIISSREAHANMSQPITRVASVNAHWTLSVRENQLCEESITICLIIAQNVVRRILKI